MIDKSKIQTLIQWYHRNSWILHLPFLFYFALSLMNIGMKKKEIVKIEVEINKHFEESKELTQKRYEEYSDLLNKKPEVEDFYKETKKSLNFILSPAFMDSEDMEGELKCIENQLLKMLDFDFDIFGMDHNYIKLAKEYPLIRKYISAKYAIAHMNILAMKLTRYDCYYSCRYFNPIVHKFADRYFLYPNIITGYDRPELIINGESIKDHTYTFQPKRRGVHILDIEYSYIYQLKKEVVKFRKGLLVK